MKKLLCMLLVAMLLATVSGCGKTKTLICDGCGVEVEVPESSNMTDDWILFCAECDDIDIPTGDQSAEN